MKLLRIWKIKDLRLKVLTVLAILALTRVLAHVPIPALSIADIRQLFEGNQLFGLLNIFGGGGLENLSIAMLGVMPYITAAIIIQLLSAVVPYFRELSKEGGEAGRAKINKFTMYLTVPLVVLQSIGTMVLLSRGGPGIGVMNFPQLTPFEWIVSIIAITAGTMLLVWLGELITNYGIGNGISLIIFAGIIAMLPESLRQILATYDPSQLASVVFFAVIALVVTVAIVYSNEAQRNIPVTYAKRARGAGSAGGIATHLPLRLLQAGVMPIIFAISIMIFPPLVANFFLNARTEFVANAAQWINDMFLNQTFYAAAYFFLVFIFTYFYTSIIFNPDDVAENIQKSGGFIPGIRPGRQTADYLYKILNRITTAGAIILGLIAILPFMMQGAFDTAVLTIGGTSLLIVVAVAVDTMKQIEAQVAMREYEGL